MPLAEGAGHKTVVAQNAWQRGAAARPDRRIARVWARELGDRSEAHPVMVAPGQQRRAGRRAHRRDMEAVVGQPILRHPSQRRGPDGAAKGIRAAEPGVIDQHDQHVRGIVGRAGAGDDGPVADRLRGGAPHRAAEAALGYRQPGAVRVELTHRLLQSRDQASQRRTTQLGDRFHRRAGQCLPDGQATLRRGHGDDYRAARGHLPILSARPLLIDGGRRCPRPLRPRRRPPPIPTGPVRTGRSPGRPRRPTPRRAARADFRCRPGWGCRRCPCRSAPPLQREALVLGPIGEGLKVVPGRIDVLIAGNGDQCVFLTQDETPCY